MNRISSVVFNLFGVRKYGRANGGGLVSLSQPSRALGKFIAALIILLGMAHASRHQVKEAK